MSDKVNKWVERAKMFAVVLAVLSPALNAAAFFWLQERFPTRKEFDANNKLQAELYEDLKRSVAGRWSKLEQAEYVRTHDEMRAELVASLRRDSVAATQNIHRELAQLNDRMKRFEDWMLSRKQL